MLCVCSVAWRRGCVAWRVVCGGEEAGVGHGAGAAEARKEPKQECARAGSGRIKYKPASEDAGRSARAGGASVHLPWQLYFTLRCVCRAGRVGAGETGCRGRNRDYRHPLEATPFLYGCRPANVALRALRMRQECVYCRQTGVVRTAPQEDFFLLFHQIIRSLLS